MKKYFVLSLSLWLAACAMHQGSGQKPCPWLTPLALAQEPCVESAPVKVEPVTPVAPCGCASCASDVESCTNCQYVPDACREVLRPRITKITVKETCRTCPPDPQAVKCGNSTCRTFKETQIVAETANVIVPAMPEAYELAAKRAYERMEKAGNGWCTNKPSVYVQVPQVLSSDLPAGAESGVAQTKRLIANGNTFTLAQNVNDADYTLETTVDWFDTPTKQVPAIQYRTAVYDKKHNRVEEWVEVVKFADNQSWL